MKQKIILFFALCFAWLVDGSQFTVGNSGLTDFDYEGARYSNFRVRVVGEDLFGKSYEEVVLYINRNAKKIPAVYVGDNILATPQAGIFRFHPSTKQFTMVVIADKAKTMSKPEKTIIYVADILLDAPLEKDEQLAIELSGVNLHNGLDLIYEISKEVKEN